MTDARTPGSRTPSAAGVRRSAPTDLTRAAAQRYLPPGEPGAADASPGGQLAVAAKRDPLRVAAAYLRTRLTYRFDDLAGYTAALTAPTFSTPAFAARSRPSAAALARLAAARETSAVRVGGAELQGEAPNSARARYVVVSCTVTTAYRGGGHTAPALWTLRLLRGARGQWRVDGVLSTD